MRDYSSNKKSSKVSLYKKGDFCQLCFCEELLYTKYLEHELNKALILLNNSYRQLLMSHVQGAEKIDIILPPGTRSFFIFF